VGPSGFSQSHEHAPGAGVRARIVAPAVEGVLVSTTEESLAKGKSGRDVASRIAQFIGKSLAGLANRRDALQRELADVERQMAGVRDAVMRRLEAGQKPVGKIKAKVVRRSARRSLSPETRAKMAAAAKRRWAAAKKAGKKALG
jgi:hypothetical protein